MYRAAIQSHLQLDLTTPMVVRSGLLDWAVGSLVVRASDSRREALGSMPPNTLRVYTEYVLVKSVGPKVLWMVAAETKNAGGWRIFLSPPVPCLNCGGGYRWCCHLS
ncbi:uncharacterized protein TNCV_3139421 [Trichonephila clavipes]|nr:uncharacterized protein TNCV_3139421 [Trichonephila clavipes]